MQGDMFSPEPNQPSRVRQPTQQGGNLSSIIDQLLGQPTRPSSIGRIIGGVVGAKLGMPAVGAMAGQYIGGQFDNDEDDPAMNAVRARQRRGY